MSIDMLEIIRKKRDGYKLSHNEIDYLISSYVENKVPDYQIAALLMAIYFKGLDQEELKSFTKSMANSGKVLELDKLGFILDKHSTGGVGDTTTLVVLPLVASLGCYIAKLSGRGLGHTGGTIDKLEAIPGFRTELTESELIQKVKATGVAISGQTENLAPADKLFYALRDVTATVESIPLIASSIMSKKIAGGAHGIVLDVKIGRGAFMKDLESARELATIMVELGTLVGRKVTAVISDMDVPLSRAIGNTLEVLEALEVLQGNGGRRLKELSLVLSEEMLRLNGTDLSSLSLEKQLEKGYGYQRFVDLVRSQGGTISELKLSAQFQKSIVATRDGYFEDADAYQIGEIVCDLGAGRKTKGTQVDLDVGVLFSRDLGDWITKGEVLATIYANDELKLIEAHKRLTDVLVIGDRPYAKPVVFEIIRSDG